MLTPNTPRTPIWKKPARSGTGPDSNCVEIAHLDTTIAIRDSKQATAPNVPLLQATPAEWKTLLAFITAQT